MTGLQTRLAVVPGFILAFTMGLANVYSQGNSPASAPPDLRDSIPTSISPQARAIYEKTFPALDAQRKVMVIPDTQAGFDALNAQLTAIAQPATDSLIKKLGVVTAEYKLNGVGVFETKPPNYKDDGTVLIRVHGGGFVLGSARATAGSDAVMALFTGKRIISVDYTLAPRGKWQLVTDQVVAVYKAVLTQGYAPRSIGMYGDSAGGNIVPASILKLRDQGVPMPGAVVLLSPCIDVELNGDTETTLAHADPILDEKDIIKGLKAYADPADWKNPYVLGIHLTQVPPTGCGLGYFLLMAESTICL
jgi:monoterpene epsilon-lactone hydrolase